MCIYIYKRLCKQLSLCLKSCFQISFFSQIPFNVTEQYLVKYQLSMTTLFFSREITKQVNNQVQGGFAI